GRLETAFPDGPPADAAAEAEGAEDAEGSDGETAVEDEGGESAARTERAAEHLAATDNANVVLVGDVDILSDRLWVQAQSFLGQQLMTAFASNGDFVVNAMDNLSGSTD